MQNVQKENHPFDSPGWTYNAPKAGYNKDQLKDEDYHRTLAIHDPLWRYIIKHYPLESFSPITVVGYAAMPVAIELSQWTYPVTYITDTPEGVKKAKRDCEIHAGSFKNFFYFDFLKNIPQTRVVTFFNILNHLTTEEIYDYLDLLLRRCREVVCSVPDTRDWKTILSGKYCYNMSKYNKGEFCLLTIKQYE